MNQEPLPETLLKPETILSDIRENDEALESLRKSPSYRDLRIAVFGVRDSGKSSLMASWYLFRDSHHHLNNDKETKIKLVFNDIPTQNYLRTISTHLLETGSTQQTGLIPPEVIKLRARIDGEWWNVETIDYPGEFLSPDAQGQHAQRARKFLASCDSILVLFAYNDQTLETMDALDILCDRGRRHFIVAVTKLDEFTEHVPVGKVETEEVFTNLEQHNVAFEQLRSHISAYRRTGTSYLLPVYPQGKKFDRGPIKLGDLRPCYTHVPLSLIASHKLRQERELRERQTALQVAMQSARSTLEAQIEDVRSRRFNSDESNSQLAIRVRAIQRDAARLCDGDLVASCQALIDEISHQDDVLKLEREFAEVEPQVENYIAYAASRGVVAQMLDRFQESPHWLDNIQEMRARAESLGVSSIRLKCDSLLSRLKRPH